MKRNVVSLPLLKTMANPVGGIKSKLLNLLFKGKYKRILKKFDWYISPYPPIAPAVYDSGIKSAIFVYDIIPAIYPRLVVDDAKLSKKVLKEQSIAVKHFDAIKTDIIFTDSVSCKHDFLNFKPSFPKENIIPVMLGAEKNFYPENNARKIDAVKQKYKITGKHYFLSVSGITPRKNYIHLLKSFFKYIDITHDKDTVLVITGPVPRKETHVSRFLSGISEKYRSKVVLTGFIDDSDMAALYSGARIFAYPSLYEGFGLPLLEAMQCKTPVITADNSSLPEVGGDAVLYVSGYDENETAEALKSLNKNEKMRKTLAEKGFKRAKEFNWKKTVDTVTKHLLNT